MNFSDWFWLVIGGLPLLVFTVYVLMRVGSAGFFKSKQQFEQQGVDDAKK